MIARIPHKVFAFVSLFFFSLFFTLSLSLSFSESPLLFRELSARAQQTLILPLVYKPGQANFYYSVQRAYNGEKQDNGLAHFSHLGFLWIGFMEKRC